MIAIKGVDMPKECRAVEVKFYIPNNTHSDNIYINGREMLDLEISALFTAEHLNNIIQIPRPHGDLIDRDIVRDEYYKTMEELVQSTTINISAEALSLLCGFTIVNNIPTIIEAEE